MREAAIVRLTFRELSYLPWLALGGAALTLGVLASAVPVTVVGSEALRGSTATGDATGWALSGMFPAALWGGIVASGPASVVHLLSRPISRTRIIAARLLVVTVILAVCGLLVGLAGRSLAIHDMVPLSVAEQAVMLCYAITSGAVARCLRPDEPFAVGIGVLLLGLSSASVSLATSFVGVSVGRSLHALGWAALPICALVVVTATVPLVRHWARFVPLGGRWVLAQCAAAYVGVLALHSLLLWYPIAIAATLPHAASPAAVLGRAPDGRLWLATGEPPLWTADSKPFTRVARQATRIDGLVLRDERGQTRVTGWFGGADWLGLGQPGEVVELRASPDGRVVAVITESHDTAHVELYDTGGLRARHSRPRAQRTGQRLQWSADGRSLIDVVVTPRALDVLLLRLEDATTTASHTIVAGERGALLGFRGSRPWLRRDGEAIALDASGRITATVPLTLPMARLAPAGGHLASYDPEGSVVELSRLHPPSQPSQRLELPSGTTKVRGLVWLDADHVAVLIGLPTGEHQSRMLVFHVAGHAVADVPSHAYHLDELYGPPSGPWIRRDATELAAIDRSGHPLWRHDIPTITDDMVPTPVVYDRNGVRYVDHRGVVREQAYPWWGG